MKAFERLSRRRVRSFLNGCGGFVFNVLGEYRQGAGFNIITGTLLFLVVYDDGAVSITFLSER